MRTIQHPLSGALYDLDDDGNIVVTLDDKTGHLHQGRRLAVG